MADADNREPRAKQDPEASPVPTPAKGGPELTADQPPDAHGTRETPENASAQAQRTRTEGPRRLPQP